MADTTQSTGVLATPTDEPRQPRGQTVVTSKAVATIARQAAGEVDGVELVLRSGLRRLLADFLPVGGGHGASAAVATGTTTIELHLAVSWPRPVGKVSEEVRRHVRERVQDLTGYAVTDVDIVVESLPAPDDRAPRAVR